MSSQTVITFGLGDVLYALPVAPVMEILASQPAAPLPRTPAHVLGLIDRRGMSVPVVDLRGLLGEFPTEETDETRIIVLRLDAPGGGPRGIGLRVDRVIEVTAFDEAEAAPLEEAGLLRWNERAVAGIGRHRGRFVTLLNVDALFADDAAGLAALEEAMS